MSSYPSNPVSSVQPTVSLRLTRRGQRVLLIALVALVFVALSFYAGRSAAVPAAGPLEPTRVVIVDPNQTLWDIATRVAPGADPRATIEEILLLNGLHSAGDLAIGQRLAVPTG